MTEKIALVIDSGTDVPSIIRSRSDVRILPLRVIYPDKEYIDGIDIDSKTVYSRMPREIPKTSLPSMEDILAVFTELKSEGYTHVVAVTISSGLSGTYNTIRLISEEIEDLTVSVIDTKNISIGSGFTAVQVARDIDNKLNFDEIVSRASASLSKSVIYFTVGTLEYLRKGGRIGLVAGTVADMMNVKPIISCNKDGIYYTVEKARGRKNSIKALISRAQSFVPAGVKYQVCVIHGQVQEEFDSLVNEVREKFKDATEIFALSTTAALGVHTGPGALGIGIKLL